MTRNSTLSQWLQATALLALMSLVFLWEPLTSGGFHAPGDLHQSVPILRTAPDDYQVSNPVLGDLSSDIVPWQKYNREQIHDGQLPLWNPYNGSGVPHLANSQSAVYSPFNFPFYIMSFRLALIASVAMVLMVAGLATYGLSKHLGARHLGALVAATGFAFAGVNIFYLRWPVAPSTAMIPLVAWASLAIVEAPTRSRRLLAFVAAAASVGTSLLGGNPEVTFYGLAGVIVLIAVRLIFRQQRAERLAGRLALVAGSFAAGAALAAAQIIPTLQYLFLRAPSGDRQAFIDPHLAGLIVVPFLRGSFFGSARSGVMADPIPYGKAINASLSIVLLFLAVIGLISLFRKKPALGGAVTAVGLVGTVFLFDLGGIGSTLVKLPVLDLVMAMRSILLFHLAAALLAARGVDDLTEHFRRARAATESESARSWSPRRPLSAIAISAAAVTFVLLGAVVSLRGKILPDLAAGGESAAAIQSAHLLFLVGWLAVTVLTVTALVLIAPAVHAGRNSYKLLSGVTAVGVLVPLFATSGFMFRGWNPTVEAKYFYAQSPAITAVKNRVGSDMVLGVDRAEIPPDLNMAYKIRSPFNYDAIGVGSYQETVMRVLDVAPTIFSGTQIGILQGPVHPEGTGNLRMLGIQWVTTGSLYPWTEKEFRTSRVGTDGDSRVWKFAATDSGDETVSELVVAGPLGTTAASCRIRVSNNDKLSEPWVHKSKCGNSGLSVSLPDPIAIGEGLRVNLSVFDGADEPLATSADVSVVAINTKVQGLQMDTEVDGFRLYRVPGAPGYAYSPAVTVDKDPDHTVVDDPDADPENLALVSTSDGRSDGTGPGEVDLHRAVAGDIALSVARADPGWVIVNEAFYPGWVATVDGVKTPVRRANDAFMAVRVPAGESLVELRYRPRSVSAGLGVSLVSLVALLGIAGYATTKERQRRSRDRKPT